MAYSELKTISDVQSRLWKGYGKVAAKQGQLTEIHRPNDPLNGIGNKIGETPIVFTNNFGFVKPDKFGVSWLFAIFDGSQTRQGDFLVTNGFSSDDTTDVFYIAALNVNLPVVVVKCPRTVTVLRVGTPTAGPNGMKGVLSYAGATQAKETVLMQNWRASILQGTKGETNPAHLPGDVRMPWWTILMPFYPGIILDTGDIIRCDLGNKYMISSAEITNMGWRITATYERA